MAQREWDYGIGKLSQLKTKFLVKTKTGICRAADITTNQGYILHPNVSYFRLFAFTSPELVEIIKNHFTMNKLRPNQKKHLCLGLQSHPFFFSNPNGPVK